MSCGVVVQHVVCAAVSCSVKQTMHCGAVMRRMACATGRLGRNTTAHVTLHLTSQQVADFGFATLAFPTQIGVVGTPYWTAPEVLRGEGATKMSDVYSFAITMFEVLSRKEPYDGLATQVVLAAVGDAKGTVFRPQVPERAPPYLVQVPPHHRAQQPLPQPQPQGL